MGQDVIPTQNLEGDIMNIRGHSSVSIQGGLYGCRFVQKNVFMQEEETVATDCRRTH